MRDSDYIKRDREYGANNYEPLPVVISRGEGVYVWDVEGRKYLDMLSAYSALNQGHRHPRIIDALVRQAEKLTLTSRAFHNDVMGAFIEKLSGIVGYERVLPMNTGAEAVETMIKMARKWAYDVKGVPVNKARIIAAENNFHGRTLGAISMSSSRIGTTGFGPFMPCIDKVPYGDVVALEKAITADTAAFIVEPLQGEGGVIVPPKDYFPAVREICTKNNVLLCADEIQTGLGRTGRMLCMDNYGVRADMITLGKALGGGVYPVSAACADSEIMSVFTPGTHGSTFGGNPLAAAVAMASLDVIIDEDLPARAVRLGGLFKSLLREMNAPNIKEIRGLGLLIGVEFTEPVAHDVALALLSNGLLAKDTRSNIIRFAPPLVISEQQIDDAACIIESVLAR